MDREDVPVALLGMALLLMLAGLEVVVAEVASQNGEGQKADHHDPSSPKESKPEDRR